MRGLNECFRFVCNNDQLAVIVGEGGQQFITVVQNPRVTEVTYEHTSSIEARRMNGDFVIRDSPVRVNLELTGMLKEELYGENADEHIPDIAEGLSVEQLLAAANKKLEDR